MLKQVKRVAAAAGMAGVLAIGALTGGTPASAAPVTSQSQYPQWIGTFPTDFDCQVKAVALSLANYPTSYFCDANYLYRWVQY
ncbi:hypothetical protein [Micromonospora sp. NPDC049102]|uniref:hypothetical protein n=1 Tax=Micromonospora sp. NPDC049102 TaxID=3364265 RepID=UPI00371B2294